jgi:hypothetical protein
MGRNNNKNIGKGFSYQFLINVVITIIIAYLTTKSIFSSAKG